MLTRWCLLFESERCKIFSCFPVSFLATSIPMLTLSLWDNGSYLQQLHQHHVFRARFEAEPPSQAEANTLQWIFSPVSRSKLTDSVVTDRTSLEESLVLVIFHCRLKNMKKLIKSTLYQKRSTVRGQSFSKSSVCLWSSYPQKNVKLIS